MNNLLPQEYCQSCGAPIFDFNGTAIHPKRCWRCGWQESHTISNYEIFTTNKYKAITGS